MTMLLLWTPAISSVVIVATQSAERTWLGMLWVVVCLIIAMVGTVMYQIERRRQKRWDAGNYD